MICNLCGKPNATIYFKGIVNNQAIKLHLCESCAREIGLNSKLSNFSLSIPEMLSFLDVSEVDESAVGSVCKSCGMSFVDYSKENKLGCPDCYMHMEDSLKSVIAGYHGAVRHVGKQPSGLASLAPGTYARSARTLPAKQSLDELKKQLNRAVFEERYEDAAVLRDRINDMDRGKGNI